MKPLLIGEANPRGVDPRYALYPEPAGCTGWRLCHRVLGLTEKQYLKQFDRVNLCYQSWSVTKAREAAQKILSEREGPLILLGAKVCQAFDLGFDPFTIQTSLLPHREILILPHPSGRCYAWHDPKSASKAQVLVATLYDKTEKIPAKTQEAGIVC